MRLRFLGISTGKDGCPTLYDTDRQTYVVQGWRVSDPAVRARSGLQVGETCVEVPAHLMTFLEEPRDSHIGDYLRPSFVTEKGTYVIRGPEITDQETLSQMDVPDHETAVEVPKRLMVEVARETVWSG